MADITTIIRTLIPIKENDGKQAVSARDLHAFLESKQQFADWIKNRINKYDLIENEDYVTASEIYETANGGHSTRLEYILTIDAAKELSMVEGNERGKQARRYFIACEQKLKEISSPSYTIEDPIKRAERWIEEEKKRRQLMAENQEQAKRIEESKPKVLFADAVTESRSSCLVAELAKILKQNGVDMGQNRLFAWMRENGYLCQKGEYYNQPTQKAQEMGLFEIKKVTIERPDGSTMVKVTTKVTCKGQIYFINKFLGGNKNVLERELRKRFASTPKEEIDNEWDKRSYLNNIGPDVIESLTIKKPKHRNEKRAKGHWEM